MAARHGTRQRYNEGCRCEDCTAANTAYQQAYRHRPTAVVRLSTPVTPSTFDRGPVETGSRPRLQDWPKRAPDLLKLRWRWHASWRRPQGGFESAGRGQGAGFAAGQAAFCLSVWSSRQFIAGQVDDDEFTIGLKAGEFGLDGTKRHSVGRGLVRALWCQPQLEVFCF